MGDDNKVNAFWQKCDENRKVSDLAQDNGYLNAAASRYYYALFLGFNSLFEKKGIPIPDKISVKGELRNNPNKGTWPRKELHEQARLMFPDYKIDIEELLWIAFRLRVRADYKAIPVSNYEIDELKIKADELFKVMEDEIKKNE